MKLALALLLCLPGDLGADIGRKLAQPAVLRGTFTQEKHLNNFKKPLLSRGSFVLARQRGILWDTREPFASTLSIGHDRIVGKRNDGSTLFALSSQDAPLFAVNEILFALLAGDAHSLEKHFTVQGDAGDPWHLTLVATDPGVAKILVRVGLTGDRFVRRIDLTEATGDTSILRFTDLTDVPALNPNEVARFE